MHTAANIAVGIIALIHVYILVLEMFLWEKPAGLRAFGLNRDFATATRVLAGNQGLYNGFLAAGLFWGLAAGSSVRRSSRCCAGATSSLAGSPSLSMSGWLSPAWR